MLRYCWPALLWALIVLFLSAHPQMGITKPWGLLQPDKIAHAGAYALLAFLLHYAFPKFYWPVIIGTVYGILIEFMQEAFFYGRQLDVFDMLADFVGCGLGVWLFTYFAPLLPFARK